MSAGTTHRLELAAVMDADGVEHESIRSAPIDLIIVAVRTGTTGAGRSQRAIAAQDGVRFDVDRDREAHRIAECMTPVFLWIERENGVLRLYADVARGPNSYKHSPGFRI